VSDFSIKIDAGALEPSDDDIDGNVHHLASFSPRNNDVSDDFFALQVKPDPAPKRKSTKRHKEPHKKSKKSTKNAKVEPKDDEFVITDVSNPRSLNAPRVESQPPALETKKTTQSNHPKRSRRPSHTPASLKVHKPFKSQTIARIANVDVRDALGRDEDISMIDDAIPLSKAKRRERQKPMLIDVDRLVNERSASKRVKINTIDVLKHLVQTFEPPKQSAERVDPAIVHHEFRMHLMNYLSVLQDMHANINDLTEEIQEIQRRKRDLRAEVYEIRKKHGEVGTQLSGLRQSYLDSKYNHEQFIKNADQLRLLKERTIGDGQNSIDLHSVVESQVAAVNKLVNPVSGIYSKLRMINNQLENRRN
jgi:hypothetical protein